VIRNARIHNLKNVDASFPKGALSVVTGVSGSGKSSLVMDVLEVEARRRFLESLTLYERQATREGPAALVDEVTGLGVSISIKDERRLLNQRATTGTETEISHNLALLMAWTGDCTCSHCGQVMTSTPTGSAGSSWRCPNCRSEFAAEARHFSPTFYAAACKRCHGVGTLQEPNPSKLIINPEKPLCGGAMFSPGFFPKGYLCKPNNHGYDMVQALADRHSFDPAHTPWQEMSPEAQQAFLYGEAEPLEVTLRSRTQTLVRSIVYPGFYGFIRDWDVGGTYTDQILCPECQGARLRPQYLAVTLACFNLHELSQMSLSDLAPIMEELSTTLSIRVAPAIHRLVANSIQAVQSRLRFLIRVGLGYLHLNRATSTLSAGEAQRIKLAALLGGGLKSLTILLDEPSRGLHPSEVDALVDVLHDLRDQGNSVIVVEHDLSIIKSADYLLDMGPGSGLNGGHVVAEGTPDQVAKADTPTALWLRGESRMGLGQKRRQPDSWLTIRCPTANNLKGEDVHIPLGVLVGVCGVSGSGKSSLMIDTLGRALAPKKHTTSVAQEPIDPGPHEAIEGAPQRVLIVDQAKEGVVSPASYLGLDRPLRALFADSGQARSNGLAINDFVRNCSVCKGRGYSIIDMGFLPSLHSPCEACNGSGYQTEVREIRLRGLTLPEVSALTIDELYAIFGDQDSIRLLLSVARKVGLGHLVLRQPGYALSGGEIQRLKMTKELSRKTVPETMYILDEPTVGQHLDDVRHLVTVLQRLVAAGHSVAVVEHHPSLLAACDWLIELGPGGGPDGGYIIANGTPELLSNGQSATARYLKEIIELV
jgi:excinuclease ABC subunit A